MTRLLPHPEKKKASRIEVQILKMIKTWKISHSLRLSRPHNYERKLILSQVVKSDFNYFLKTPENNPSFHPPAGTDDRKRGSIETVSTTTYTVQLYTNSTRLFDN